jgi:hypothetical protein
MSIALSQDETSWWDRNEKHVIIGWMIVVRFFMSIAFVFALIGLSLASMGERVAFAKAHETKPDESAHQLAEQGINNTNDKTSVKTLKKKTAKTSNESDDQSARQTVNLDDPNLAFTAEYASDSATVCPKSLHGKKLHECLLRLGIVGGEEISERTDTLSQISPRSVH